MANEMEKVKKSLVEWVENRRMVDEVAGGEEVFQLAYKMASVMSIHMLMAVLRENGLADLAEAMKAEEEEG